MKGDIKMNNFKDISIATEILAIMFSKNMFNKDEVRRLLKEKDLVASGDKATIEKVINVYGAEIKEELRHE